MLFLFAGIVAGEGGLGAIPLTPNDAIVHQLADLALFSVLFTDGMCVNLKELKSSWHYPTRALLLGLPLTALGAAALCHWVAGFSWLESLLIGAILSPTDPVFAAAIVGREEIPARVRHLLNVESGLNDGLALPLVLVLAAVLAQRTVGLPLLAGRLALGVVIGIVLPWVASRLECSRLFGIAKPYEPLFAVAVGLLVLATASLTQGNLYLAAFAAGVTIATTRSDLRDEFHRFGELITELLKLAALLVFGGLISLRFLSEVPWGGYVAAALILLIVRPVAILISLFGTSFTWAERLTVGWFGPKGFASAIYGVLLFSYGVPHAERLFHLVAVVIAASIIAHSSTDVPIARWFCRQREATRSQAESGSPG